MGVWPEMAIPTLKHKGLGHVGDPTSGGDPRMGRGDPRIYKKIFKIKSSTLDFQERSKIGPKIRRVTPSRHRLKSKKTKKSKRSKVPLWIFRKGPKLDQK